MLTNREVILAKVESAYGTDATPTGTDAILCGNIQFKPTATRMHERHAVTSSVATSKKIYGGRLGEITFDVESRGSGAAGAAPEFAALLKACAMQETVVASTSVTYVPRSTGQESITIYYYQDGIRTILTGCVGDFSLKIETGKPAIYSFRFVGHASSPSDVSVVTPTYDSTVPVPLLDSAFTLGGTAIDFTSVEFSLNNEVATPTSAQGADGYGQMRVGKRDVTGKIDPEMVTVAVKAYVSLWAAGTSMAVTTGAIGTAAGNICTVAAGQCYFTDVSDSDRDGIRAYDITFGCAESAAGQNDDISIEYT